MTIRRLTPIKMKFTFVLIVLHSSIGLFSCKKKGQVSYKDATVVFGTATHSLETRNHMETVSKGRVVKVQRVKRLRYIFRCVKSRLVHFGVHSWNKERGGADMFTLTYHW